MAAAAVVPAVNLNIPHEGYLVLDRETLARIFVGNITKWNDPSIALLQSPEVASILPASSIFVVLHADGAGTTSIFTEYLAKDPSLWPYGKISTWPSNLLPLYNQYQIVSGNLNVVSSISQHPNSIGFFAYPFSIDADTAVSVVNLLNDQGETVTVGNIIFRN